MQGKRTTGPCEQCGTLFRRRSRAGKPKPFCSLACFRASHAPEGRFWSQVNKNGPIPEACPERGPCWLWAGSLFTDSGYGQFWLDNTNRRAHIVSYEWASGPTNGQQVQHLCNVRVCVNPAHLTLGTPAENTAYAVKHGRLASGDRHWLRSGPDTRQHAKGERNGSAKLTEAVVRDIKRQRSAGVSRKSLAVQYGVTYWTIRDIDTGKIWSYVT